MVPMRRSARQRKSSAKSADGGWNKRPRRRLRESSELSTSSLSEEDKDAYSQNRAFRDHLVGRDLSEDNELRRKSSRTKSKESEIQGSVAFDNDSHFNPEGLGESRKWTTTLALSAHPTSSTGHARGLAPLATPENQKNDAYSLTFGSRVEDLKPILHARDHWLRGRDITLPSRLTLRGSESSYLSHRAENPAISMSMNLQDLFLPQQLVHLPAHHSNDFSTRDHVLVVGSSKSRQLFKLKRFEPFNLRKLRSDVGNITENGSIQPTPRTCPISSPGWILYTGKRINDISWAPATDGDQLLAIVCKASAEERASVPSMPFERPLAFYPSSSWPAEIQIWRFGTSTPPGELHPILSTSHSPIIDKIFRMNCGDIKQVVWSPLHHSDYLGLMALLSTDGHARIIAIDSKSHDTPAANSSDVKTCPPLGKIICKPAIDLQPPESVVFTAIAWLSSTDLAIGASDGTLRLYNLLQDCSSGQILHSYLTQQIHGTYITSISPAYPSSTPYYIASTSASGEVVLTDLRCPDQDQVQLQKSGLQRKPLVYAPLTRSWVTISESATLAGSHNTSQSLVECHHLRHFYRGFPIARLPELSGTGTSLAASPHHPCILIGNAKGTVFATNYLRSVLPIKPAPAEMGSYLQKVCEYEFRPENCFTQTPTEDRDSIFHSPDVRSGTSYLTESFIPEAINLGTPACCNQRGGYKKGVEKGKVMEESNSATEAIYEEEQAVTALTWHPKYAGWAAIGWGSGIVRVLDLSH